MELEPMRFVFTIPLPPEVDLGDYRSLRVEPPEVEVSEDEIQEVLEEVRGSEAMLKPVEDRGAQVGDVLALSLEGRSEDGEILLDEPEIELLLDPEEDGPAPGFYEELVGMESGDERTFKLEMPDDSPVDVVEFSVSVHDVFDRILPGLDDDLARAVGKFDSLEELREEIREGIRDGKQAEAEDDYAIDALDALVERATIRYPDEAVEEMIDELIEAEAENIRRQHHLSFEDYLMVLGKTEDELRADLRPVAEARLERSLVLSGLIQAEELATDEEELEERIVDISESLGIGAEKVREQLSTEKGRQLVTDNLLIEKAFSRLATIARGEAEAEAEAEE
jgi:trigger factor